MSDIEKWQQPQEVDTLTAAFGGSMDILLPPMDIIPSEFKRNSRSNEWNEFQNTWFFYGLSEKTQYFPKEGIDKDKALKHLSAIQGSFAPKHEHKMAAVAWLASLWFDKIKVVKLKEKL